MSANLPARATVPSLSSALSATPAPCVPESSRPMIAIIDYGWATFAACRRASRRSATRPWSPATRPSWPRADKVVLPGVGAFEDAIAELRRRDLVEPIRQAIDSGKPFLGHLPGPATAVRRELRKRQARRAGHAAGRGRAVRPAARSTKSAHGLEPAGRSADRPPLLAGLAERTSLSTSSTRTTSCRRTRR